MNRYKQAFLHFFRHRGYTAAVLLTALCSFGTTFFQVTIGRDSLEGGRYIGDGHVMITTGRFGMNFWARFLGYGEAGPAYAPAINLLAALLLVLAAAAFCVLLRKICGDRISMFGYGLFSCLFISYPLINEIWEYAGANVCVSGGYLLDALALNCLYDLLHEPQLTRGQKLGRILTTLFGLTIVCSSYESLAAVFVLGVFAVLTLEQLFSTQKLPLNRVILHGCFYAAALAAGLVLRMVLQFLLPAVLQVSAAAGTVNGETELQWLAMPLREVLRWLVRNFIIYYGMRGCFYLPILEFAAALAVFLVLLAAVVFVRKRPGMLLTGAGMLLSLVLLALVQGTYSPYRTCQTFALFVALTALALYEVIRAKTHRAGLLWVVQALAVLLCLRQAVYLNHLLVLDHQRSEEEAAVVRSIGTELEQNYDTDKPVVITGIYTLSSSITQEVTANAADSALYRAFQQKTGWETEETIRFVDSNCNSVLSWAVGAFREEGTYGSAMEKLFAYYGFPLQLEHSATLHAQAMAYREANPMPAYPAQGSIVDCGTYILVNLG